jgi:hypothetical protein
MPGKQTKIFVKVTLRIFLESGKFYLWVVIYKVEIFHFFCTKSLKSLESIVNI